MDYLHFLKQILIYLLQNKLNYTINTISFRSFMKTAEKNLSPQSQRKACETMMISLASTKHVSRVVRKPTISIGENKGADRIRGADQRLSFCYTDITLPLLLKSEISSF